MSLVRKKEVRSITVTYADGSEETFDPIVGFLREERNYVKGARNPDDGFTQHEIRWSDSHTVVVET